MCRGRHFGRGAKASNERFRIGVGYTVALRVYTVRSLLDLIVYCQYCLERPQDRAPWRGHQQRRDGAVIQPQPGCDREWFAASKPLYRGQQNPLFHADVLKKSAAELAERLHINIVEIAAGASEQLI